MLYIRDIRELNDLQILGNRSDKVAGWIRRLCRVLWQGEEEVSNAGMTEQTYNWTSWFELPAGHRHLDTIPRWLLVRLITNDCRKYNKEGVTGASKVITVSSESSLSTTAYTLAQVQDRSTFRSVHDADDFKWGKMLRFVWVICLNLVSKVNWSVQGGLLL